MTITCMLIEITRVFPLQPVWRPAKTLDSTLSDAEPILGIARLRRRGGGAEEYVYSFNLARSLRIRSCPLQGLQGCPCVRRSCQEGLGQAPRC